MKQITTIEVGDMDLERLVKLLTAIAAPWVEEGATIKVRTRIEMFVEDWPKVETVVEPVTPQAD